MPFNLEQLLPIVLPIFFVGLFVLIFGLAFGPLVVDGIRHNRLRANGETAEAIILDIQETGVRVNRQPRVKITLEVRPSLRSAYQATTHKIVSYFEISKYQPGSVMEVKFDPNHLQNVVIIGPRASAWGGTFPVAGGAMPNVTSSQTYVVNGQTYSSLDQLPPEARKALGSISGLLGDANQNGIPDIMEQGLSNLSGAQVINTNASNITEDRVKKLSELKTMLDQGLITEDEYDAKKKSILDRM
jgi:putative oligomerization/nucleic acid binding protein/uncharacterized protein DUF3592